LTKPRALARQAEAAAPLCPIWACFSRQVEGDRDHDDGWGSSAQLPRKKPPGRRNAAEGGGSLTAEPALQRAKARLPTFYAKLILK